MSQILSRSLGDTKRKKATGIRSFLAPARGNDRNSQESEDSWLQRGKSDISLSCSLEWSLGDQALFLRVPRAV
ncbi:hypothetical protein A2U01_0060548 [Trifolium medium]|uniref:Uncharacterized protein n=1 Tax=Trifolium medium TaxID=97028 RepID=A0A392RT38_9FABA|nr:hypothetical protein [Trifolium medium]